MSSLWRFTDEVFDRLSYGERAPGLCSHTRDASFAGADRRFLVVVDFAELPDVELALNLRCDECVRAGVTSLPLPLDRPCAVVGDLETRVAVCRPESNPMRSTWGKCLTTSSTAVWSAPRAFFVPRLDAATNRRSEECTCRARNLKCRYQAILYSCASFLRWGWALDFSRIVASIQQSALASSAKTSSRTDCGSSVAWNTRSR
jgi:hypothetical protein